MTCHKHPGADWPETEFKECLVKLGHGQEQKLKLAERRTELSKGFAVREVRHLQTSGHQTSVLASAQRLSPGAVAGGMFARRSPENFLKYLREHDALDHWLSDQVENMDETTQVVNPAWRKLDRAVRSLTAKLHPKPARFGAMNLAEPIEPDAVETEPASKESVGEPARDTT